MSTGKGKGKVSIPEIEALIDRVKLLIEKCIVRNLNKEEVIEVLYEQHEIDRSLTEIIWERLVEDNQEFFENYHSKLVMKEQAEMMKQSKVPGTVPSVAESSGSNIPQINTDHGAPSLLEKMSTGEDRKQEEKQRVKDLIKQYVVNFTSQKQVIDILYQTEKIEPSFTMAVWEELEQEDSVFFKNCYPTDLADQHSSSVTPATSK